MFLYEFLKSDDVSLPKIRSVKEASFPSYLKKIFKKYISGLEAVEGKDKLTVFVRNKIHISQKLVHNLNKIVKKYFDGLPHESFKLLNDFISSDSSILNRLYSTPIDPNYLSDLYRIRIEDDEEFTRRKMFHIPFQLRHKVTTQRFSIPGFPSLYLGSSCYLCWNELGCPALDSVYSVRLEANQEIRVLDLGYTPQDLSVIVKGMAIDNSDDSRKIEYFASHILNWPLIAACTVRVLYPDAPFKPEYIVPQLLLQYVKEDKTENIDGVRYFTVRYGNPFNPLLLGSNFVFPVKTARKEGLCQKLVNLFQSTEVLSWQTATASGLRERSRSRDPGSIQLVKNHDSPYDNTFFGKIEGYSRYMPVLPLD